MESMLAGITDAIKLATAVLALLTALLVLANTIVGFLTRAVADKGKRTRLDKTHKVPEPQPVPPTASKTSSPCSDEESTEVSPNLAPIGGADDYESQRSQRRATAIEGLRSLRRAQSPVSKAQISRLR